MIDEEYIPKCGSAEFNFIGQKFCLEDRKLFRPSDELIEIKREDTTIAHLLARVGIFKSVGEARRNGWDRPVPTGWAEFRVGNKFTGKFVFIWNPSTTLDELWRYKMLDELLTGLKHHARLMGDISSEDLTQQAIAAIEKMKLALEEISELSSKRSLPLTVEINDIANRARNKEI